MRAQKVLEGLRYERVKTGLPEFGKKDIGGVSFELQEQRRSTWFKSKINEQPTSKTGAVTVP